MLKSNEIKQAATFLNSIANLDNTELKSQFEKLPANVQNKIKNAVIKASK
tara:strand:+ start:432 stop:581 length:150 start_codon:yes stop_codon:yes gene_type:complete